MGRRSTNKTRNIDPERQAEWVALLSPHFRDKGIKNFSMDDMAEVIGISKATLYKYFKSRDEIVALFITDKLKKSAGFVTRLHDEGQPYIDRYKNAVAYFCETVADTSVLLLTDLKELYPDIWLMINQFRDYSTKILTEYYEQGIKEGIFNPIHTAILAAGDQYALTILTDPDFLKKTDMTLGEAIEEYFELRANGIIKR
jgi:AcrR family transcriptional regulator